MDSYLSDSNEEMSDDSRFYSGGNTNESKIKDRKGRVSGETGVWPPALRAGGPVSDTRGGPNVLRLSYGFERVKLPRALGRRSYLAAASRTKRPHA